MLFCSLRTSLSHRSFRFLRRREVPGRKSEVIRKVPRGVAETSLPGSRLYHVVTRLHRAGKSLSLPAVGGSNGRRGLRARLLRERGLTLWVGEVTSMKPFSSPSPFPTDPSPRISSLSHSHLDWGVSHFSFEVPFFPFNSWKEPDTT